MNDYDFQDLCTQCKCNNAHGLIITIKGPRFIYFAMELSINISVECEL